MVARYFFHQYKTKLESEKETLSNVELAKMFYYILKTSFNGQGGHFACNRKPGINLIEIDRIIDEAHQRLKRVVIENLDYQLSLWWREEVQV
jgi:site-specific DNA-adenine methylase